MEDIRRIRNGVIEKLIWAAIVLFGGIIFYAAVHFINESSIKYSQPVIPNKDWMIDPRRTQ